MNEKLIIHVIYVIYLFELLPEVTFQKLRRFMGVVL